MERQDDDTVMLFYWAVRAGTVLTLSCPLVSCWLTPCSSCCSSLTVWFSPAVIFSFLSISSCQRQNGWVQCIPLITIHAKTYHQLLQHPKCPRLLLSVTTDCYSLSGHQHCPSHLRAPPGSDQETAGPGLRTRKFHLLTIWHRVGPLPAV